MKSRSCGLVQRIGTVPVLPRHTPTPANGDEPPRYIPLSPPLLDSSFRWNDELSGGSLSRIVVRDMLSYQWTN